MQYNFNNPMHKLKRKLSKVIPQGFIIYYLLTAAAVYILYYFMNVKEILYYLVFDKDLILHGQIWRAVTFVLLPVLRYAPIFAVLFFIFDYYLFRQIEIAWGTVDTFLYLIFSILAQIVVGMMFGYADISYTLFYTIMFIYSIYYSHQRVYIFYVLPIEAKFFSYVIIVLLTMDFFVATFPVKMSILASVLVFVIYFRKIVVQSTKLFIRRLSNYLKK